MPEPTIRQAVNLSEDWMILVFLFTLVSLAYTRRVHPARIFRLWSSMWNVRTMRQSIREEPNTPRANLLFNTVFYLQTALLLYGAINLFRPEVNFRGITYYLILVGVVFGVYLIKLIGLRAIGLLGDGDFSLSEYEYRIFLTNRLVGLLFFPLGLSMVYFPINYAESIIWISGITSVFVIIYRTIRALLTALETGVTPFYILFYICTLEFLPFALCVKWLMTI